MYSMPFYEVSTLTYCFMHDRALGYSNSSCYWKKPALLLYSSTWAGPIPSQRQRIKVKSGLCLPLHFSSEPKLVGEKTADFKAWIGCGDLASLSSKGILIPKLVLHIGNTRYVQLCFRKGGSRLLSK